MCQDYKCGDNNYIKSEACTVLEKISRIKVGAVKCSKRLVSEKEITGKMHAGQN